MKKPIGIEKLGKLRLGMYDNEQNKYVVFNLQVGFAEGDMSNTTAIFLFPNEIYEVDDILVKAVKEHTKNSIWFTKPDEQVEDSRSLMIDNQLFRYSIMGDVLAVAKWEPEFCILVNIDWKFQSMDLLSCRIGSGYNGKPINKSPWFFDNDDASNPENFGKSLNEFLTIYRSVFFMGSERVINYTNAETVRLPAGYIPTINVVTNKNKITV